MQRSGLALVALTIVGTAIAFVLGGPMAALLAAAALGTGCALGIAVTPNPVARARVRKLPRKQAGYAKAHVSFVPVQGAEPRGSPRMEAGAARMADPHGQSLRLTGDILRGMQTGGKTTRGLCSQCGATLWLSARRPVKACCPACGFTRILS